MGTAVRIGILLALVAAEAPAQKMYRCGSIYQDRPCADGQKGKVVGTTGSAAAASPGGGIPQCAQRGRDSLKIVWSREGGATQEKLLAEAKTADERQLIQDVWRRGGAASQVQAAVEADCNVEVQKREEAAALAAATAKARQEAGLPPEQSPAAPSLRSAPDPQAGARASAEQAAREAERKKQTCDRLSSSMENLRNRERAGGSQATLDRLTEERRRLRDDVSRTGC